MAKLSLLASLRAATLHPVRLSLTIRIVVAIATAAALRAFLLPGACMLVVSTGLRDRVSVGLAPRLTVTVGGSALVILGSRLAANRLCLTIFNLWHIDSSRFPSIPLRIAIGAAVLVVPLIVKPIYCHQFIVPLPAQAISRDHQAA